MHSLISDLQLCIDLSQDLQNKLETEKFCLVHFKTDELNQNNIQKEELLASIILKRQEMKKQMEKEFGSSQSSVVLPLIPEEERNLLEQKQKEWERNWEKTIQLCKRNRDFIDCSQATLQILGDHLRSLFTDSQTYGEDGTPRELHHEGKVIEGSF